MKHTLPGPSKFAAVLSAGGLVLASFGFPASLSVAQGRGGGPPGLGRHGGGPPGLGRLGVGRPGVGRPGVGSGPGGSGLGLPGPSGGLSITSAPWSCGPNCPSDAPSGVNLYTLTNRNGMKVNISNYGGVVQSIWVPSRTHQLVDVALGFPYLGDYVNDFQNQPWPDIATGQSGDTYFGAIIGRYANRIADASFTLNGTTYPLPENNNETTTLHGGPNSYNTKVWTANAITTNNYVALQLNYTDPAGYNGFPGAVSNTVTYSLDNNNNLHIYYEATSTASTVINLTNHTYFNLGGEGSGSVMGQYLQINADTYTPTDQYQIPTGAFVPVQGTAFDFTTMHPIGEYIHDTTLPDGGNQPYPQLVIAHGYDFNWVLNGYPSDCYSTVSCLSAYKLGATAFDPTTGIVLHEFTDQPGVQLYTGNFLQGDLVGPSGQTYRQGDGFTLETQHFPDTPHHIGQAAWPSVVLNPGEQFNSCTTYQFGTEGPGFAHFPPAGPPGKPFVNFPPPASPSASAAICPQETAS